MAKVEFWLVLALAWSLNGLRYPISKVTTLVLLTCSEIKYFIAVRFNDIGVSTLRMAIAPKLVATN